MHACKHVWRVVQACKHLVMHVGLPGCSGPPHSHSHPPTRGGFQLLAGQPAWAQSVAGKDPHPPANPHSPPHRGASIEAEEVDAGPHQQPRAAGRQGGVRGQELFSNCRGLVEQRLVNRKWRCSDSMGCRHKARLAPMLENKPRRTLPPPPHHPHGQLGGKQALILRRARHWVPCWWYWWREAIKYPNPGGGKL